MLGSLKLYLKGMRIMTFQLSGFYYNSALPSRWRSLVKGTHDPKGKHNPLGSKFRVQGLGAKDSFFTAVGPKDHTL